MQRPKHDQKPLSYSEILRALGQYVDRYNLSEIRILETEEGVVLQGLVMQGEKAGELEIPRFERYSQNRGKLKFLGIRR